jgi:hypothetical protein
LGGAGLIRALATLFICQGPRKLRAGSVLLSDRGQWRSSSINACNSGRVKHGQAVAPCRVRFRCNERAAPCLRDLEPALACLRVRKPNTNATRPGPLRNAQPPFDAVPSEVCIQLSVSSSAFSAASAASIFMLRGALVHHEPPCAMMCTWGASRTAQDEGLSSLERKYYEAR